MQFSLFGQPSVIYIPPPTGTTFKTKRDVIKRSRRNVGRHLFTRDLPSLTGGHKVSDFVSNFWVGNLFSLSFTSRFLLQRGFVLHSNLLLFRSGFLLFLNTGLHTLHIHLP